MHVLYRDQFLRSSMKFGLTSMQNRSFIEWTVTKSDHPGIFTNILIPNLNEIRWIVSNVNHVVRYSYTLVMHFMSETYKYSSQSQFIPFTPCNDVCRFNRLTPNDPYMGRTAPLTSKRCILYIYSTNIGSEYFKHALYSPFFPLQNAVCFIMLTCLVPVLFTFCIRSVLKLKK